MSSVLNAQEFVNLLPAGDMEDETQWRINTNGNSVTMAIEDGIGRENTKGMSVEITAMDGDKNFFVINNNDELYFTQDDSITVSFWAKSTPNASNDTAYVMPFIQAGADDGYAWMNLANSGFGIIPNDQWQFFTYDTLVTSGTSATYKVKLRGSSVGNYVIDDFQIGLTVPGGAVRVDEVPVNSFSIYPNPVENTLYIGTETSLKKYVIFNACGSIIKEGTHNTIDVSSLERGMYFITMNGSKAQKFIKR